MSKRQEFNEKYPVTGNYTACQQTKDFMKAHPVLPPGEVPIPEILQTSGLSLEEAKAEYMKLDSAPKPKYGWNTGMQTRIDGRLEYLKTMVFDHIMKG